MIDNYNIKNKRLFKGEILDDNQSWQSFVRSTEAFTPLIKHIYQINNMQLEEISYITVASNAVFRVGDKVIKIFYPPEAGIRDSREYETEVAVMNHADTVGILAPRIICNGVVQDGQYNFSYIITNYIEGILARDAIPKFDEKEKREFSFKMKAIMDKFNVTNNTIKIPRFDESAYLSNPVWNDSLESFNEDRNLYIKNVNFPETIVAHGDLIWANVIIDKQERIHLLDFAESIFAPYYYDWTAILFLFYYDKVMIKEYFGDCTGDEFFDTLTMSFLLPSRGPGFGGMKWAIAEDFNVDVNEITKSIVDVNALKNILIKWFGIN